jgi:hypothetical protein
MSNFSSLLFPLSVTITNYPPDDKINSVFSTVQSNSSLNWEYQGSDIKALTGDWIGGNAAYTNLVSNSASYLSGFDLSFLSVSGNWDSVYSIVNTNSSTWDSVYTTVLNESASWIGGGGITAGEYLPLSGGVMTGPISFSYIYGSKLDQGIYDSNRSGLSGISLVCSVNYDFNWQSGWITALEQDRLTPRPLYIDSGAGTSLRVWDGRNFPTSGIEISHSQITFADNTTQITAFTGNTLTFDEITKDLSISNGNTISLSALVDMSSTDTGVRLLTSNWDSTYTTVQNNSSTDWNYQGTDLKNLSSGWVGGNSAYTTTNSNSGNWDSTYTTVQSNSSTTWNYQGSDLKSLSANWQSTYTTLSSNSASYIRANTSDTTPVYSIRALTQTQYDAISIKDPNTLYFITT